MDLQLSGKRALVTGSSSGIGVGIAEALTAEGVQVIVHGRDEARANAVAARLGTVAVIGSLSTPEGAASVVQATLDAVEGIDILVNNAGGSAEVKNPSWFKVSPEILVETYQANVVAAARLIHAFAPGMKERGWGRIINIGTGASITPTSAQPDYGPSKAALLNLSLGVSKALAGSGVTSNTVSPGMIRTEGLMRFLADFAEKRGWGDDIAQAEQYVLKGTGQTVEKVGEPADIAYFVTMIASPRSDFLNGVNVHADGGISPSIH